MKRNQVDIFQVNPFISVVGTHQILNYFVLFCCYFFSFCIHVDLGRKMSDNFDDYRKTKNLSDCENCLARKHG